MVAVEWVHYRLWLELDKIGCIRVAQKPLAHAKAYSIGKYKISQETRADSG